MLDLMIYLLLTGCAMNLMTNFFNDILWVSYMILDEGSDTDPIKQIFFEWSENCRNDFPHIFI